MSTRHEVFMQRIGLRVLHQRQWDRFDRCCHGGVVSYRLPLTFRLDVAYRWGPK